MPDAACSEIRAIFVWRVFHGLSHVRVGMGDEVHVILERNKLSAIVAFAIGAEIFHEFLLVCEVLRSSFVLLRQWLRCWSGRPVHIVVAPHARER